MIDRIRELIERLGCSLRGRKRDGEFDEELSAHLDLAIRDNLAEGMPPEEARREALLRLGGVVQTRELQRDSRGLPALDAFLQDLGYSLRSLRRDAGLTTFAILIVGLGVGASSTVFSVVNALLLRPLPFDHPDRLVWIANNQGEGLSSETVQVGHLLGFREQTHLFSDVAAYFAFYGVGDAKLTGTGEPERLTSVPVSQNFFPLLGVKPTLGRLFTPDECKWNGPRAVLLSHALWQRRFAADPAIVGQPITLDRQPVTVVGVLPASFDFGSVFAPGGRIDLYSPFPLTQETNRMGNTSALIGRLAPGATIDAARSEARVVAARTTQENPQWNHFVPKLDMLREHVSGQFRGAMFLLACAVGVVMLIVCANLSNLLLARSATRQKEMAIRAALGAGRGRLVRQVLTESLVLSCGGALLGVLFAAGAVRLVAHGSAISIPLLDQVRLDTGALGFALLVAVLTGIGFGLTPALRVSSLSLHSTLKESDRGSTEGAGYGWTRRALVISEVALASILLAGAGLLIRSFTHVLDVDLGFRPESAVTLRIDARSQYATQALRNTYYDEALRRVRSAPGIDTAGLTDALPLGVNRSWGIRVKDKVYPRGQGPDVFVRVVSDGYFSAMGIPLRAGRDFSTRDGLSSEPVIIINETLASRVWPGEDPLGKIIHTDKPERRVVGVVADVRHLALEKESGFEMYLPIRQTNDYASVDLVVRGSHSTADLASAVRGALQPLDPSLPMNEFRSIQGLVDRSVSPRRFLVVLLAGFAGFALILAGLGIYGVISYSVSQRKREIGIRMALGASAGDVQQRILWSALNLAAVGLSLGFVASWALGRLIQGLLFEVAPSDPVTFAAMLVALMGVAVLAAYLPARRASRLDPLEALRAE
jgi:putative ABC transport system permease protein